MSSSTSAAEEFVSIPRDWATGALTDCGFDYLTDLNGDPMQRIDGVLQNLVHECAGLTMIRSRFLRRQAMLKFEGIGWNRYDARTLIDDAFTQCGNGKPTTTCEWMTADQLATTFDGRWLVAGILPASAHVFWYGPSDSYKSFLALDLACCIATGTPWHGEPIDVSGPVAYVFGEGSRGAWQDRARAWCLAHDGPDDLAELPVRFHPSPVNVMHEPSVTAFVASLEQWDDPPVLCVLDTVSRCLEAGGSATKEETGILAYNRTVSAIQRATGATTLGIHHTGWDTSRERGDNSLRNAADVRVKVERLAPDSSTVTMSCEKMKDAEPFPLRTFTMKPSGDSLAVHATGESPDAALDGSAETVRTLLYTLNDIDVGNGATPTEWMRTAGVPRSTFYRNRRLMLRAGYVRMVGDPKRPRFRLDTRGAEYVSPTGVPGDDGEPNSPMGLP